MEQALIAHVDEATERVFSYFFKEAGYRVLTAYNGGEAIYYLSDPQLPSVVLVDFDLPIISGADVLKYLKIKKAASPQPIFVIAVTISVPSTGQIPLRPDMIIQKPVTLNHLAALVEYFPTPSYNHNHIA